MYQSNIHEVVTNILGKISGASLDKMQGEIATTLRASNVRRIHNEGKNIFLQSIGRYSQKPLYVNPKNSPKKFEPKGKTGKSTFNNGKKHKTAYFSSYGNFRQKIGRESAFVNLQLTGGLRSAWQIKKLTSGYAIGFWSNKYADRAEGLEKHFGNKEIWGVTTQDKKVVDEIINNFIK